jgi:hypothetical protein
LNGETKGEGKLKNGWCVLMLLNCDNVSSFPDSAWLPAARANLSDDDNNSKKVQKNSPTFNKSKAHIVAAFLEPFSDALPEKVSDHAQKVSDLIICHTIFANLWKTWPQDVTAAVWGKLVTKSEKKNERFHQQMSHLNLNFLEWNDAAIAVAAKSASQVKDAHCKAKEGAPLRFLQQNFFDMSRQTAGFLGIQRMSQRLESHLDLRIETGATVDSGD